MISRREILDRIQAAEWHLRSIARELRDLTNQAAQLAECEPDPAPPGPSTDCVPRLTSEQGPPY